jgi:hypothetical protein
MQQSHHLSELRAIKVQSPNSRVVPPKAKVDRVRAILDSGEQTCPISGRSQKFGLDGDGSRGSIAGGRRIDRDLHIELGVAGHDSALGCCDGIASLTLRKKRYPREEPSYRMSRCHFEMHLYDPCTT